MGRRISRDLDGTSTTGKSLADLLPEVLQKIVPNSEVLCEEIFRAWRELLGEEMAQLTEPLSFSKGALIVKVKSATLYSLLSLHEKPRLLRELGKKFSIRNIVLRVG